MKKLSVFAIATIVLILACKKDDDPTPAVVTPPTHKDSTTVKKALAGSKWQLTHTSVTTSTQYYTDTIEVASDSITVIWKTHDNLNITNNASDTLIYINPNSFFITQSSNPTLYNQYEYLDHPSENVYRFNSGPAAAGDKNYASTNQWITTFTKIQ